MFYICIVREHFPAHLPEHFYEQPHEHLHSDFYEDLFEVTLLYPWHDGRGVRRECVRKDDRRVVRPNKFKPISEYKQECIYMYMYIYIYIYILSVLEIVKTRFYRFLFRTSR